jgi:hypothetical protein
MGWSVAQVFEIKEKGDALRPACRQVPRQRFVK